MRRRRATEESPHAERWLVSYADFMTLLFALFVVLYASSHHDRQAIQRVSTAVKNGFQEMGSFSQSGIAPGADAEPGREPSPTPNPAVSSPAPNAPTGIDVAALQRELEKTLGKEIARKEVDMRMTPEGFVVSLLELGFFESGEARLMPEAAGKITRIASILNQYGLDMRVEGNSDNIPIHNASFSSNWDLSTARATAVAMMLLDQPGVDPSKISIAGYGQYHPVASNDTAEGRRANRRVDIVVVKAVKPF